MKELWKIERIWGSYEEDSFDEGIVDGGHYFDCEPLDYLQGNTYQTLIELLRDTCDTAGVSLDHRCYDIDEDGRIDMGFETDEDGNEASDRELADWKEGKIKLYYFSITIEVKKVPIPTPGRVPTAEEMEAALAEGK